MLAAAIRARPDLADAFPCYCDDLCANLGASGDRAKFLKVIRFVESFGFLINWDKTPTDPATRVETLGFIVDTVLMAYDVPHRRLAKLQTTSEILALRDRVRARAVARLTGQVWSLQPALGLICRLRCQYLTRSIAAAARSFDYGAFVRLGDFAVHEIGLWRSDLAHWPRRPLQHHLRRPGIILESDASLHAYAARVSVPARSADATPLPRPVLGLDGAEIRRELLPLERARSSTLREMPGYEHAICSVVRHAAAHLAGLLVSIIGDSKVARDIFTRGSSQRESDDATDELLVLECLLRTFRMARHGDFELSFRWVPRDDLEHADRLAVTHDRMGFGLNESHLAHVESTFGPWVIDRFAAPHNTTCTRFNSAHYSAEAEGVDALGQDWREGTSFVLGDFNKVDEVPTSSSATTPARSSSCPCGGSSAGGAATTPSCGGSAWPATSSSATHPSSSTPPTPTTASSARRSTTRS